MNILFVCKHNVFRSKIAEAYFKKINKNKNIKADSAGIIIPGELDETQKKLIKFQRGLAKNLGLNIEKTSKQMSLSLLRKQDMIIVAADNLPAKLFRDMYTKPNLKIIQWKIADAKGDKNDKLLIKESIEKIMRNVDKLVEELK